MNDGLSDAAELRDQRARLKREYSTLYDQLEKLLFQHDPIGISYVPDEYDPEVERLLPKLSRIKSERELTDVIHDVFVQMFDAHIAGPRDRYAPIARDIWRLLYEDRPKPVIADQLPKQIWAGAGAAATIFRLEPDSGPARGGIPVLIYGSGFVCSRRSPNVTFSTTDATVKRCDASVIEVILPAHTPGYVDVQVTNIEQASSNALRFRYE
jgi:hypothetical protein